MTDETLEAARPRECLNQHRSAVGREDTGHDSGDGDAPRPLAIRWPKPPREEVGEAAQSHDPIRERGYEEGISRRVVPASDVGDMARSRQSDLQILGKWRQQQLRSHERQEPQGTQEYPEECSIRLVQE